MKNTSSESDSAEIAFEALNLYFEKDIKDNQLVIVDVGAGQPSFYSNTAFFREKNSKIVSIDAMPRNVAMFKEANLDILHYAVTETDTPETVLFREFPDAIQGLAGSTIASVSDSLLGMEPHLGRAVHYDVPAKSLNSILKEHHPEIDHIDILDIDTEGNEINILKGSNLDYYKPKVLIVENISGEYDQFYNSLGYETYAKCAHNDILIRKK
jgi:FkbM family methyltransferase